MLIVDTNLVRYLVVGFLNTLLGLMVIYFAMYVLRFGVVAANVIGYAVGVVVSFLLNQRWTFAHRGPARRLVLSQGQPEKGRRILLLP